MRNFVQHCRFDARGGADGPPAKPIAATSTTKTIALGELADELGIYKQTVFKIANRLGI
jgi:hypothetical protein